MRESTAASSRYVYVRSVKGEKGYSKGAGLTLIEVVCSCLFCGKSERRVAKLDELFMSVKQ